jgi:hypothetical protein
MRAAMSGAPPGGMVTTILIGRDGYWASATAQTAKPRTKAMSLAIM